MSKKKGFRWDKIESQKIDAPHPSKHNISCKCVALTRVDKMYVPVEIIIQDGAVTGIKELSEPEHMLFATTRAADKIMEHGEEWQKVGWDGSVV